MTVANVRKLISPVIPDGQATDLVTDAFGALTIQDPCLKFTLEGRHYFYNRGNITTPVSFTQTTVVYARPSLVLRVPAGKAVIPTHLGVQIEAATGTINELIWLIASNDVGAGTSTAVTTLRGNLRGDIASNMGGCLINITYTGDYTTAPTNPNELKRWVQPFVDAAAVSSHDFYWDIKTDSNVPLLVGPASLLLVGGASTAHSGFVQMSWAEYNSADFGL